MTVAMAGRGFSMNMEMDSTGGGDGECAPYRPEFGDEDYAAMVMAIYGSEAGEMGIQPLGRA